MLGVRERRRELRSREPSQPTDEVREPPVRLSIPRPAAVKEKKPKIPSQQSLSKGTLDDWLEPSITHRPSYIDHGGQPYGVLEHMQPLGEAPNAKVKARVKPDGVRENCGVQGCGGGRFGFTKHAREHSCSNCSGSHFRGCSFACSARSGNVDTHSRVGGGRTL